MRPRSALLPRSGPCPEASPSFGGFHHQHVHRSTLATECPPLGRFSAAHKRPRIHVDVNLEISDTTGPPDAVSDVNGLCHNNGVLVSTIDVTQHKTANRCDMTWRCIHLALCIFLDFFGASWAGIKSPPCPCQRANLIGHMLSSRPSGVVFSSLPPRRRHMWSRRSRASPAECTAAEKSHHANDTAHPMVPASVGRYWKLPAGRAFLFCRLL